MAEIADEFGLRGHIQSSGLTYLLYVFDSLANNFPTFTAHTHLTY